MDLVTPSQTFSEPIELEEALWHLRVTDGLFNDEVARLLASAREFCERQAGRTLRVDISRVLTDCGWWSFDLVLPWPPLRSVTSVKYYDADNVQQTLASSEYRVLLSTDGKGRVEWVDGVTLPAVYTRQDAIEVTFVTGYESTSLIPRTAIQAILTKLTELWGSGTDNELKAAAAGSKALLNTVDMTGYA